MPYYPIPSSGGGASFLWDTFDYSVGDFAGDGEMIPYNRPVTFTLKQGSTAITEDTVVQFTFMDESLGFISWSDGSANTIDDFVIVGDSTVQKAAIGMF